MGEIDNQMKSVSFTRMSDGTAEEYAFLTLLYEKCRNGVSDRLLELLKAMKGDKLGYQVDRYTHSLQSATRAELDGADEETVVCALLHDLGDVIAPDNHSEVIASILRPYISEKNHWVLKHHGLFQGYYYFHHIGGDRNARERYKDHPFYQDCVDFCEKWDQTSFDPDYPTLPLEYFEPMVRKVLTAPKHTWE
ncbi:MAG: HD domain-containing protein [SAR324 cluster bacterium]|nr:HD domain-containing protein [SAR324 cluster bacterium]